MFKAVQNVIVEVATGKQIAVVLPTNCSRKQANSMAAYAAQQLNHEARAKTLKTAQKELPQ